jgi:hypothetical protein
MAGWRLDPVRGREGHQLGSGMARTPVFGQKRWPSPTLRLPEGRPAEPGTRLRSAGVNHERLRCLPKMNKFLTGKTASCYYGPSLDERRSQGARRNSSRFRLKKQAEGIGLKDRGSVRYT